ncbi:MAG: hypothetical protein HC851_22950 [Acaryochloris sp. RU_4_1]|nr:hypothetical protein [Acaryochloris sp. RU_4_1]
MAVEIFTDWDFSGTTSGRLDQDYPSIGDFWNDKASSIKVYSDTWEFFEHVNFQGRSFRLGQGSYPRLDNGWNDVISSIKKVGISQNNVVQRVLDLSNAERAKVGAPPLRFNAQLTAVAQAHTNLMVQYNQLSHQLPSEPSLGDRVSQAGYRWSGIAENIAQGQQTPEAVLQSWMNSPHHRDNLLNPKYRDLGVGYANNYWTQDFGVPV